MLHEASQPGTGGDWLNPAERELEAFSYSVSHDLSARFRHVEQFTRLLLDDLGPDLNERQREFADLVRTAADDCLGMLSQLLTFSRIQRKALERVSHDADRSLQMAMRRLVSLETADAEITMEPLGEVCADAHMLIVALQGLIDNAVKFHRAGQRPQVSIKPAHDAESWRVRISDNGIGVDPAGRERAFEMFKRLNGEDAYPGVGAGLAICRRIARRHGGDAAFLDSPQGACVELSLPYDAPAPVELRAARPEP